MNRCYIYAYRVDGALWYIGKGSGSRIGRHLRRAKRHAKGLPMHRIAAWQIDLSNALATGSIVTIEKLADNLPEPVALSLEIDLIAELRPLKNKLPGGEGGRIAK